MKYRPPQDRIQRSLLSRPVALALEDGLLSTKTTFFAHRCGRGPDLKRLHQRRAPVDGCDPAFLLDEDRTTADVVNLGHVVNIIEGPHERAVALRAAWELAQKLDHHPARSRFARLTARETERHLYDNTSTIGTTRPGVPFQRIPDLRSKDTALSEPHQRAPTQIPRPDPQIQSALTTRPRHPRNRRPTTPNPTSYPLLRSLTTPRYVAANVPHCANR